LTVKENPNIGYISFYTFYLPMFISEQEE